MTTTPNGLRSSFYGLTLLALALALTVFVRYAAENPRLVKDEVAAEDVESALVHQPDFLFYGIGIGVGIFFPRIGVILFLLTALYVGIPGRTIHRLLRGQPRASDEPPSVSG